MSEPIVQAIFSSGQRLEIVHGDITAEQVDAIVNAANEQLVHGGGTAGAIVRKGGESIQDESDRWIEQHGPVPHASPAYTRAGRLPCKFVIHAVGPYWGQGDEDNRLSTAIMGSLQRAEELEVKSLALPAISTGIFGFPKDRAAPIFFNTIQSYFANNPTSKLNLVRLVIFDKHSLDIFVDHFKIWLQGIGE